LTILYHTKQQSQQIKATQTLIDNGIAISKP